MIYQFKCKECDHSFDKSLPINDRDLPLSQSCPDCQKVGAVLRVYNGMPIAYMGFVDPIRRAGTGWNDVLKKIKKGAGISNKVNTY